MPSFSLISFSDIPREVRFARNRLAMQTLLALGTTFFLFTVLECSLVILLVELCNIVISSPDVVDSHQASTWGRIMVPLCQSLDETWIFLASVREAGAAGFPHSRTLRPN